MDTSFRLQNQAISQFKPIGQKALAPNPAVKAEIPVTSTPAESFVSSRPLKVAREGSEMAQMVQDLQDNGVIPQAETVQPQAQTKPLREPSSDYMAQMVESIQNDRNVGSGPGSMHVQVNDNGTIAVLDDTDFYSSLHLEDTPKPHGTTHVLGHGHKHSLKEDGLLGGHMGTEVVEKVGHEAHHAATHAAQGHGEAASHAATQVKTEVAGHAVSQAKTEVAGHAVSQAKTEAAGHLAQSKAQIGAHGAETAAEASDATTAQLGNISKVAAHHLSTGMEIALGVGTIGAGILAVPLTYNGVKELKHGIKEKNTEKILEGVGGIAVGTRSAATAAVMGGMLTTSEVVTNIAGAAATTLTPLGLVHAGVDTVLGIRDIKMGKTTEGLLKIGTGVAVGTAAVVGGLPMALVALGMLGVKVTHKLYSHHQDKKHAAESQQQQNSADTSQLASAQLPSPNLEVKT